VIDDDTHLRPFREADLDLLTRFAEDPDFSAPFEWAGFGSPETFRRRWEEDGFLTTDPHYLVVAGQVVAGQVVTGPSALGWVMWERPYRGLGRSDVWVIGILLAPEHRGRGVGTRAQHLLVDHLFDTTPAHRLCAFTDSENVAEQKSLEKCGFRREGVLRETGFRGGRWRDLVVYGLLRPERPSR
jgi:RimJ/RimL family protein N-acetyltransferase